MRNLPVPQQSAGDARVVSSDVTRIVRETGFSAREVEDALTQIASGPEARASLLKANKAYHEQLAAERVAAAGSASIAATAPEPEPEPVEEPPAGPAAGSGPATAPRRQARGRWSRAEPDEPVVESGLLGAARLMSRLGGFGRPATDTA